MTAADRARANAARFSTTPPVEQAAEQARAARTARTKPIRSSLDLPPARHHALRAREVELAQELGAVRGVRQALVSAMVHVFLTDVTVARRVEAQLAEDLRQT